MTIPPEIVQQILREQEERKRTQQNAVRNILLALLGFLFVQYVVPWGVERWQMANEKQRQLEEVQRQLDELRARTQSQGPQEEEDEDEGDEGKKESKKPSPPPPPSLPKPKPRPTESKAAAAVKAESTSPDAVTGLRRRAAPPPSSSSNSAAAAAAASAAAAAAAQANPWSGLGRAPDPSLLEARRIRLQQDDDFASLQASQEAAAAGQRRVAAEARAREEREQRDCDDFKVEFLRRCEAAAEAAAGAGGAEGEKDGGSIRLSLRFLGGRVDCSFSPSTTAEALLDYIESHALFISAATADFEGGEVTKDELLGLGLGQGLGLGAGEVVVAARKTSSAATSAGAGVTPLKTAIATPAPAPSPPSSSSASSADKAKARGRVLQLAALEAAALVVHPKQQLSRSGPRPSLSLPLSHLLRGATSAVVQVLARPREEGEEVDI